MKYNWNDSKGIASALYSAWPEITPFDMKNEILIKKIMDLELVDPAEKPLDIQLAAICHNIILLRHNAKPEDLMNTRPACLD
jgi:Fe-S-cluster formation regulator IscX/YfhJ